MNRNSCDYRIYKNKLKKMLRGLYAVLSAFAFVFTPLVYCLAFDSNAADNSAVAGIVGTAPEKESAYTYLSDSEAAESICGMSKYGDITVLRETSPALYKNMVSVLDTSGASGWIASDGCASVSASDSFNSYPWKTLYGGKCVSAFVDSGQPGQWHYFERNFTVDDESVITSIAADMPSEMNISGIDAGSCNEISFALNLPNTDETSYQIRFQVYISEQEVFDEIFVVSSGGWNTVFADISGITEKANPSSAISKVRIGVCPVKSGYDTDKTHPFTMYLDGFAISDGNALRSYRYLTVDYYVYGGTFIYDDESDVYRFSATTSAASPFIETKSLRGGNLISADALRINFIDTIGCGSVTYYYKTAEQSEYSDVRSYTITTDDALLAGSNIVSCEFPIPESGITDFRIVFKDCAQDGEITIISVSPASLVFASSEKYGTIDSCKLSQSTGEVKIKGTIQSDIIKKHSGLKIHIYALDPWQKSDSATLAKMEPVAQTKIASEFTVKMQVENCGLKKYTAAVRTGTGFIIIDTDKWITNLKTTAVSQNNTSVRTKGVLTEVSEAQSIGSEAAYITVDISKILSLSLTSFSYNYGDNIYYYIQSEIDALDKIISSYRHSGIKVYLRLILTMPEDPELAARILFDDALLSSRTAGAGYYAYNIQNESGVKLLASLCSMLSERYKGGDLGSISGFIIGDEINLAYENYYAGSKTLSKFSKICADTVRIIYNSAVSVNSELNIFISFGSDFYNARAADATIHFDVRDLLVNISDRINAGGNIDWLPSVTIARTDSSAYSGTNAQKSYETQTLYTSELDVFCSFMKQKKLLYGDLPRNIMVLSESKRDKGTRESDADMRYTSEYIYDFYNISRPECSLISVFIADPVFDVYAHEQILRYLDTELSFSITSEYAKYFNDNAMSWEDIFGTVFIDSISFSRTIRKADILANEPASEGSAYLWNIDGKQNTDGWRAAKACDSLETSGFLDHKNLLVAKFDQTDSPAHWSGIINDFIYTRDFSSFDYLSMDIQLVHIPEGVDSAEIMILIYSGNNYIISEKTVSTGEWNKLVIPLSDFFKLHTIDCIKIFVRGSEGKTAIGNPTLLVSDMIATSTAHDSKYLSELIAGERNKYLYAENSESYEKLVPVLVGVIIIAILCETVYIRHRVKKYSAKTEKPPSYKHMK